MKSILPAIGGLLVLALLNFFLFRWVGDWQLSARQAERHGEVIHETHSAFGHLRVREKGSHRSLLFVGSDGREQLQSRIDLERPENLQLRYTRGLFVSFLLHPDQAEILIVGLGGGGMVRFLNERLPGIAVTAVEIDPQVVAIAETYFETVPGPKTTILTQDAFVLLADDSRSFDAIYMDAFLRPPDSESELQEKAQRLKTTAFLRQVRDRLNPGGVVAFNLIAGDATTSRDLQSIRDVFSPVHVFEIAGSGNLVVVGSTSGESLSREELQRRAGEWRAKSAPWAGEALDLEGVIEGLREGESSQPIPSKQASE